MFSTCERARNEVTIDKTLSLTVYCSFSACFTTHLAKVLFSNTNLISKNTSKSLQSCRNITGTFCCLSLTLLFIRIWRLPAPPPGFSDQEFASLYLDWSRYLTRAVEEKDREKTLHFLKGSSTFKSVRATFDYPRALLAKAQTLRLPSLLTEWGDLDVLTGSVHHQLFDFNALLVGAGDSKSWTIVEWLIGNPEKEFSTKALSSVFYNCLKDRNFDLCTRLFKMGALPYHELGNAIVYTVSAGDSILLEFLCNLGKEHRPDYCPYGGLTTALEREFEKELGESLIFIKILLKHFPNIYRRKALEEVFKALNGFYFSSNIVQRLLEYLEVLLKDANPQDIPQQTPQNIARMTRLLQRVLDDQAFEYLRFLHHHGISFDETITSLQNSEIIHDWEQGEQEKILSILQSAQNPSAKSARV